MLSQYVFSYPDRWKLASSHGRGTFHRTTAGDFSQLHTMFLMWGAHPEFKTL